MDKSFLVKKDDFYNDRMPIAKVCHDSIKDIYKITKNDEFIYTSEEKNKDIDEIENDKMEDFIKYLRINKIKTTSRDYEKYEEYLIRGNDKFLNREQKATVSAYENEKMSSLRLTSKIEQFIPIPKITVESPRPSYLIIGSAGSGKSVFAGVIMYYYLYYFKDAIIYVISEKDVKTDYAYSKITKNIYQLSREEILKIASDETKQPYEHFKREGMAIVLFDDVEIYNSDKLMGPAIRSIESSILTVGRSSGVGYIGIIHSLIAGPTNSNLSLKLQESHNIVTFPMHSFPSVLRYFLEKKLVLDKKTINRIMRLQTRACTLNMRERFIIADHDIFYI
jgi:hypothetical protein